MRSDLSALLPHLSLHRVRTHDAETGRNSFAYASPLIWNAHRLVVARALILYCSSSKALFANPIVPP